MYINSSFVLNSLNLPNINTLEELANHLSLSETIIYLLSKRNYKYYQSFYISKKDGSPRKIFAPSYSMKLVQKWILMEILYKLKNSDASIAYNKGLKNPLVKNAEAHRYNLYILSVDIKDFFPSIRKNQVYNLYRKIGYNPLIAEILTNICTYKDYLPQGAVTSPYISNLVCYTLDKRLLGYCSKRDINYTRYADDLVFSSDNRKNLNIAFDVIKDILHDEGFHLNNSKTRFLTPKGRKRVAGITVNDTKIKAPKEFKKFVRSMIHRAILSGDYSNNPKILGYVSYINSIERGYKEKVIKYIEGFYDKDCIYFKDLVEQFNSNKLFKELQDMQYIELDFYGWNDEYGISNEEYLSYIHFKRQDFMEKIQKEK